MSTTQIHHTWMNKMMQLLLNNIVIVAFTAFNFHATQSGTWGAVGTLMVI